MSRTEREALEAGTVGWEGALFSGHPDWNKLLALPRPFLNREEQAFLDHEVNEACRLVNDWRVTGQDYDLSPEAWDFLKSRGFLGLVIPERFGGKGFSAYAHSQIVARLSTRSSALAVSVMVPNSLGPGELLVHYGTAEQQQRYLPRLARGEEIPAFALTSPWAGSDAAAIPDRGIVCRGIWQGREVLGMTVTWNKRYITLAPICTLLGLAFHLHDPEGLLGGESDLGITCALVPRNHPGVNVGRRHLPLNAMFMNGPTWGKDVFMPLDFIIGGAERAGQGWQMLMESLAAGRSISLPSSSTGMAQLTARTVGAYARVRHQFKMPIGYFEGVEEPLTRIGGNVYAMDALRTLAAIAVDQGERPAVLSAMAKYHATERARLVVNDGMDVIGGKGICLGPSNFLGRAYQQLPIGITVEGANILTRSLIIFGQGALRCHPYLLKEMQAAHHPDPAAGLKIFRGALLGHAIHVLRNGVRAFWHGLTGARFASAPEAVVSQARNYYRVLSRCSAANAFLSDMCILALGGKIKRLEKLSARLGDILSFMMLASAVLKRYRDEGYPAEDWPLVEWCLKDSLHRIRQAFEGVLVNFPWRPAGFLLRCILVMPSGFSWSGPDDRLGHRVARLLLDPSPTRERLTASCHLPDSPDEPVRALEEALRMAIQVEPLEKRIHEAEKTGRFAGNPEANVRDMSHVAFAAGLITESERDLILRFQALRDQVIRVDDFGNGGWTAP